MCLAVGRAHLSAQQLMETDHGNNLFLNPDASALSSLSWHDSPSQPYHGRTPALAVLHFHIQKDALRPEVVLLLPLGYAHAWGNVQVLRLEPHIMISNRTGIPLQVMHFNQQMQQTFDDQAGGATHPRGSGSRLLDIPAGENTCSHHCRLAI